MTNTEAAPARERFEQEALQHLDALYRTALSRCYYAAFGYAREHATQFLGFYPSASIELDGLRVFAENLGVLAVDWCRCLVADPKDDSFESVRCQQ